MTPKVLAHVHLAMALFWLGMVPVVLVTELQHSVPFLVMISLLALVFAEISAWQAAMGERRQDPSDEYGENDGDSLL